MKEILIDFQPDIVIEATNACDRSCPGCYAPNIIIRKGHPLASSVPTHLDSEQLQKIWPDRNRVKIASIRGGEPTLNPNILNIINFVASHSEKTYLETHGQWITKEHKMLPSLAKTNCVIKLSLDRMHGSRQQHVELILNILGAHGIKTAVAITEDSLEFFNKSKERLLPDYTGEIFWHRKANSLLGLLRPSIGVISCAGVLKATVTSSYEN